MDNFKFLKTIDLNVYDIISEAEKLYRDEYFEQCITQTRRFAEVLCKNVLGKSLTTEKTFDDMLATLKDKASTAVQEKEFIEDLYFLKREGNASVHANKVKKDGILALECLQRAFEISINYAVYYKKSDIKLLKLKYDIDLLVTGKKTKNTLSERYINEKEKRCSDKKEKVCNKNKNLKKGSSKLNHKISLFKWLLLLSIFISINLLFILYVLNLI
ncbi:DUF4145 domain-containing protein [bacterium]|nr:DUF4145 domain-containing protein [bacterium]